MRFFLSFLFISIIILFSSTSCTTDFDVNEKWKEIDIVYGLLDKKDSVQYIRINKAFLNDNRSALEIAKETDSIFHDSLIVKLQKIRNGKVEQETRLEKTYKETLEPGIFAAPGQFLYRTPKEIYPLDSSCVYKIVVENPITGVKADASSRVVGKANFHFTTQVYRGEMTFVSGLPANVTWKTGVNVRFYDFTYNIYYLEKNTVTGDSNTIKLIWPVSRFNLTPSLSGNQEMLQEIDGESFFSFMSEQVPVKQHVIRQLKQIDLVLEGGGQDIYYYITVNKPSTGIVQKKPEYTNINNGYGIFSSRTKQVFILNPKDISLNENPLTSKLSFDK